MEYYYNNRKEEKFKKLRKISINTEDEREKNQKIIKRKEINRNFLNEKYPKKIKNNQKSFIHLKNFFIFKLLLISLIISSKIYFSKNQINYWLKSSEVTMKIKGNGNIKILSDTFFKQYNQCQIFIDNEQKTQIKNEYSFDGQEISVKIIWNTIIETTASMFSGCNKTTEINLSKFDTSRVSIMSNMFSKCLLLTSLDLSNFNTTKVFLMDSMFSGCSSLISLNLSNFSTSSVNVMASMFSGCSSLVSLNVTNFATSIASVMAGMFYGCSSLVSLDLSNFKTSSATIMSSMFSNCISLISLNLYNFDTSKVNNMANMFSGCSSLKFLNLSNFDTSKVSIISGMFSGCTSLISLNLSNFDTSRVTVMDSMFKGCSSLISLDLSNFNNSGVYYMSSMFLNCSNLRYINLKKANTKSNSEIYNIFLLTSDYLIVCIDNDNDFLITILDKKINIYCNNNNPYRTNINKCYLKDSTIDNKYICDICGDDYFIKNIEINNNDDSYADCFKKIEGFYIDENVKLYKPCFNSCKTCEIEGNEELNNCIECKNEFLYELNISNSHYKNCYLNNPFSIKMSTYKFESTVEFIPINDFQNETKIILNSITNLINEINILDLNNGNDKKVIVNNKQIIMTSTTNQINNEEESNITMNLGPCEDILKDEYNISNDNPLYILQIISEEKGMKIPKIEYEIYYPLYNDNNLIKLNLTKCQGTKIDISISVKINQELDKYNSSSDYYNDICYKTTSGSGTDISLNDRRNEFVDNNISLCEENCELIEYNYAKEKAKCSCDIKTSISSYDDIKFNKNEFFKSFIDIKNIFNIKILKCDKAVLKIKELYKNYGFFIVSFVLLFYLITLIIFIIKSYKKYKKEIKKIISALKFNDIPIEKRIR